MKKLHLVCNAHLDPVWQWNWDEGAAAALCTFYSAVKLAEEYDYIFCHNEVLLYEYIEKYDPALFAKIQELVSLGKWHIMGGWYCQPDCMVPSGESIQRQMDIGKKYFKEKFNTYPTTAVNFDAFAHSRGIPQILKKNGFDSYIFCRPLPWFTWLPELPHGPFNWVGYDGSKVKALRQEDLSIYCSEPGKIKRDIPRKAQEYINDPEDDILILWGVGNHGGVNSKKDLNDIIELRDEKKGEWEIIHSTPENYFKDIQPTKDFSKEILSFIKSYSSVHNIKKAHDDLENTIYRAERFLSMLEINGIYSYDKAVFEEAEKILCQIAFHDVLSGTAVKSGTESSIRKALHAIEIVNREFIAGFFAFSSRLTKIKDGDDCFVVLNPHPYDITTTVYTELFPQLPCDEYSFSMYDDKGEAVDSQVILEESDINYHRRTRLIYKYTFPAMSVKKFGIHTEITDKKLIRCKPDTSTDDIVFTDSFKTVKISRETGLLESYISEGVEYIKGGAFQPVIFDDIEDPWGWRIATLGTNFRDFKLDKSGEKLFKGLKGVTIIEEGNILTQVEALFSYDESHIAINYYIYHDLPYIDVKLHVIWNSRMQGLKLKLPLYGEGSFTQAQYGTQFNKDEAIEFPANRFIGVQSGNKAFTIYNNCGIHSYSKTDENLYLTLLNGSAYCAHPTFEGVPLLVDETRYTGFIEIGTHDFFFRVMANSIEECEKNAQEFNQPLYSLLTFPHGEGNVTERGITLSNPNIVLTAFKALSDNKYLIRAFNNFGETQSTEIKINNASYEICLNAYSYDSYIYDGRKIIRL